MHGVLSLLRCEYTGVLPMSESECILQVKVVPGASRSRVAGRYDEGVKVQVSAAPEKGKANQAVVQVLAEWLEIKPSMIQIVSGLTQPRKTVRIGGVAQSDLAERMRELK